MKQFIIANSSGGLDKYIFTMIWWCWFLATVTMLGFIIAAKQGNNISAPAIRWIGIISVAVTVIFLIILFDNKDNEYFYYSQIGFSSLVLHNIIRAVCAAFYLKSIKNIEYAKTGVTIGMTLGLLELL